MRNLIAVFVLLVSTSVYATDYIYAGGWSKHVGNTSDITNQQHNFVGYERNHWIVGEFKNSFGKEAIIVGKTIDLFEQNEFRVKMAIGAVWGYHQCSRKEPPDDNPVICPAVAPMVSYEKYAVQPTVTVLGSALVFTIRWKFE